LESTLLFILKAPGSSPRAAYPEATPVFPVQLEVPGSDSEPESESRSLAARVHLGSGPGSDSEPVNGIGRRQLSFPKSDCGWLVREKVGTLQDCVIAGRVSLVGLGNA